MTNRELEKQIRTALEHTAPDRLDAILSSCNGQKNLMDAERSRDALAAASGLTSPPTGSPPPPKGCGPCRRRG